MKYLIVLLEDIEKVDFSQIVEDRAHLRLSVDNSKFIIKWEGEDPTFISDLSQTEGPYTLGEVMDFLYTEEWVN